MSDDKEFRPYVPASSDMPEFTVRALLLGLVMCVVLGAANAYLGLRAGMTIAATYPAAVIGMAVLRAFKGSLLEENFARTVGSIGESVAAGAIFTIPAFVILNIWSFNELQPHRVPDGERAHDRGRHPRHPVRHHPAPRDGRGPRRCPSPSRSPPARSTRPASAAPTPRSSSSRRWASAR